MKIWSLKFTVHVEHSEPIVFQKIVASEHEPDGTALTDKYWKMLLVGSPTHVASWGIDTHTVIKFSGNIAEVLLAVRVLVEPHAHQKQERVPEYNGPVIPPGHMWTES
jgi:hypothetical protein